MNPQQHHRPLFHHEEGYNLPNVHPPPSSLPPPPGSWMYIQMVWAIYSHSMPCILGNMLEWLDFGIYGYSQAEISKALFHDSITMGWIAFGLGYSIRPLGAHVLGKLADRTSRTMSFSIAILGMAGATAGLALLPAVCEENSDRDTGWWPHHYCVSTVYLSAIPAILLRCVQGFSAGASAGGVNVIQSENESSSPSQSVGVNNVSGAAASMLSAGLVYGLRALLGEEAYAVWGWRLAFGLVIPPSLLAACLLASDVHDMHGGVRLLSSTNEYELASQMVVGQQLDCVDSHRGFQDESTLCQDDESGVPTPFSTASQHDKTSSSALAPSALAPSMVSMWSVMTVSVFIQFAIASYNNLNIYLVQYATTELGFDVEMATLLAVVGKAVQLLMTPFAAALADIYGWFTVCGISGVACAMVAIPIMSTRQPSLFQIWWLVAGVLPLVSTPWIMNAPLMATSIFPRERRSERTSLVMALGTALAGFFPLVLHQIETSTSSTGNSGGDYRSGVILAVIAGMAATAIFWIRHHARQGRIIIYQRPEMV